MENASNGAYTRKGWKTMQKNNNTLRCVNRRTATYRGLVVASLAAFPRRSDFETVAAWYLAKGFDVLPVDAVASAWSLGRRAAGVAELVWQGAAGARKPPVVIVEEGGGGASLIAAQIVARSTQPTHLFLAGDVTERQWRAVAELKGRVDAGRTDADEARRKLSFLLNGELRQEAFETIRTAPPLEGLFASVTCLGLETPGMRLNFTEAHRLFGLVGVAPADIAFRGVDAMIALREKALRQLSIAA